MPLGVRGSNVLRHSKARGHSDGIRSTFKLIPTSRSQPPKAIGSFNSVKPMPLSRRARPSHSSYRLVPNQRADATGATMPAPESGEAALAEIQTGSKPPETSPALAARGETAFVPKGEQGGESSFLAACGSACESVDSARLTHVARRREVPLRRRMSFTTGC